MTYSTPKKLTKKRGNNTFSYQQRKDLLSKAEITLPSIKGISSIDEIILGQHIVFEEIDHTGTLNSCTGLAHIYHLRRPRHCEKGGTNDVAISGTKQQNIYIFDNHNHALYFRGKYVSMQQAKNIQIIHIDQHSDLNEPEKPIDITQRDNLNYLRDYTNYTCNVGNFITPFLDLYPSTTFERIKSESQLLNHSLETSCHPEPVEGPPEKTIILDIDLDFRAPEMGIKEQQATIDKTIEICKNSSLITIATSPYFLDQQQALQILNTLFPSYA